MDLETLYEQIEIPHGLTALMRLETLNAESLARVSEDEILASRERPTLPSPLAPTVPSLRRPS